MPAIRSVEPTQQGVAAFVSTIQRDTTARRFYLFRNGARLVYTDSRSTRRLDEWLDSPDYQLVGTYRRHRALTAGDVLEDIRA